MYTHWATLTFISGQCYSVLLYSQGHFGVGETVESLNTTLTQWEAVGILPVNRVSEIFTYKDFQDSNLSKSLQYSLSGKSMAMQGCGLVHSFDSRYWSCCLLHLCHVTGTCTLHCIIAGWIKDHTVWGLKYGGNRVCGLSGFEILIQLAKCHAQSLERSPSTCRHPIY